MDDGVPQPIAVPVRFGEVEVLVEATPVTAAGSQPTSAVDRLADMYGQVTSVVLRVASSTAAMVERLAAEPTAPERVVVEFGLAVSVEGDVILVRGKGESTLAVTLTYGAAAD
jgi:hypothetical protein